MAGAAVDQVNMSLFPAAASAKSFAVCGRRARARLLQVADAIWIWRSLGHDYEPRTSSYRRVKLDSVTEERGRALNDKEPESETVYACRIHAIKRAEDVCQLGGWNANAAIAHFEVHSRASAGGRLRARHLRVAYSRSR